MNYVGVDVHKKDSVLCALDERGHKLREGRVEGNASSGFAQFFAGLEGPSKAVVEACWNWGLIYDELEELEPVEEVVLAHPYKTRLIADAQIKTDRLDAHALGTLLRGNQPAKAFGRRWPGRSERRYPESSLLRRPIFFTRLFDWIVMNPDLAQFFVRLHRYFHFMRNQVGDRFSVPANHNP
jgi:hypothetical protein